MSTSDGFKTTHSMCLGSRGDEGVGMVFGRWLEASEGACGTASDHSEYGMSLVLQIAS